ncbi:MAG TPA: hypothetical protein VK892_17375 [Pyrinomonadaceae bacterium]|nr:hypothetical protein [Pyrinomonadaceae bacterium]
METKLQKKNASPIQPVLDAYSEGHSALLVSGRSFYDLIIDGEGKCVR